MEPNFKWISFINSLQLQLEVLKRVSSFQALAKSLIESTCVVLRHISFFHLSIHLSGHPKNQDEEQSQKNQKKGLSGESRNFPK